ncbi:MAG TPA: hypothetical protein PLH37_01100 [bacterium]|nr:hypothetical protein [bacterium]
MFLTVHAAAGFLIGKYIHSNLWAFVIGFVSHLLMDMPVHDSLEIKKAKANKTKKENNIIMLRIVFFIELPLIILTAVFVKLFGTTQISGSYLAGFLGAVIMDFLWGFSDVLPQVKIFKIFKKINNWTHTRFTKDTHIVWQKWLPRQLIVWLILLLFLII